LSAGPGAGASSPSPDTPAEVEATLTTGRTEAARDVAANGSGAQ
jgi:hypothetical protein